MDAVEKPKKKRSTEDELVIKYANLVKSIAYQLMSRLPASVQVDDLLQVGMVGLLEAIRNYDHKQGVAFATYAGIRIRGAMLDELRKQSWEPRSVHRKARRIGEATRSIEIQKGRNATNSEIAEALDMSLKDYHQMLQDANGYDMLSLDDLSDESEFIATCLSESVLMPIAALQKEDFKRLLSEVIARLPERERLVMVLYYDEELNLREIGAVIGVSESRISQIHSQALMHLQSRLEV